MTEENSIERVQIGVGEIDCYLRDALATGFMFGLGFCAALTIYTAGVLYFAYLVIRSLNITQS